MSSAASNGRENARWTERADWNCKGRLGYLLRLEYEGIQARILLASLHVGDIIRHTVPNEFETWRAGNMFVEFRNFMTGVSGWLAVHARKFESVVSPISIFLCYPPKWEVITDATEHRSHLIISLNTWGQDLLSDDTLHSFVLLLWLYQSFPALVPVSMLVKQGLIAYILPIHTSPIPRLIIFPPPGCRGIEDYVVSILIYK